VTPEQTAWLDHLAAEGWLTALCFGLEAAQQTIVSYDKLGEP
jgi:hypothetical protein